MSDSSNPDLTEVDVARAWKDPDYRNSLTPSQLAALPPNPAGNPELSEADLDQTTGGAYQLRPVHTFESPDCKFIINGGKPAPF